MGCQRTHTQKKGLVHSVAANPDNLESNKEAGGEHKVLRAQVRIVQVERVCPLCRARSEVFVKSIIDPPLGGSMREWHRMTRMIGPDCAVNKLCVI